MKQEIRDFKNRMCCIADPETGLVEHEYKHVITRTAIPIGGRYEVERDDTITVITRISTFDLQIERLKKIA